MPDHFRGSRKKVGVGGGYALFSLIGESIEPYLLCVDFSGRYGLAIRERELVSFLCGLFFVLRDFCLSNE